MASGTLKKRLKGVFKQSSSLNRRILETFKGKIKNIFIQSVSLSGRMSEGEAKYIALLEAYISKNKNYHSQYGQDRFVDSYYTGKKNGFFVEIGAFDGITGSNTLYFESRGWDGIVIEPNPIHTASLKKNRTCKVEAVCLAETEGQVLFTSIEGYSSTLSGIQKSYDQKHLKRISDEISRYGGTQNNIMVPAVNLKTLLNKYNVREVDYLSVDTEGSEFQILKGIDFSAVPTRLISVEINYGRGTDILNLLTRHGYHRLLRLGPDDIYERMS